MPPISLFRSSWPTPVARYLGHWPVLGLLAILLLTACASGLTDDLNGIRRDSFNVGASARLRVESENGQIIVRGEGSGSSIRVTATIENLQRVSYTATQEGDTVTVVADVANGPAWFNRDAGTHLEITVPERIELDLETSNGQVTVTGVSGPVTVATSNGRIEIAGVSGTVQARSSNGRIALDGVSGPVTAETSNGAISLSGTIPPGSVNRLRTSNGGVTVVLVDTPSLDLNARTNNGRVQVDRPITTSGAPDPTHLVGVIGAGGPQMEIQTSNGNITIQ